MILLAEDPGVSIKYENAKVPTGRFIFSKDK
jgi:hypothetical protein